MTNKVLISVLLLCFLQQGSTSKILPGVEQYEIVYPRKLHTVHKRDVERNKEKKYDDTLEYEIKANGEEVILHLEKNKDLLAKDYTETVYSDDGQQITTSPQIKDHCYYEGYIQDDADSTASISTCTGLSGYFETRGQKYLIEPLGSSDRDEHAVYEYEKLREDEPIKTCGVVNSSWDVHSKYRIGDIFKSSNSPEMKAYLKAKKYLEVYIVADNTMCYTVLGLKAVPDATKSEIYGYFNSHKTVRGKYKKYNQDVETVRQRIFGIVNYINTVYKAINIYVALIGLEIWTDNDKCLLSRTAGFTLDSFSKWRNSDLLKRKRNDNAQLITGYDFEGTTIGLAFLKSICSDVYSAGIIQDHSRNEIAVGATMAHEMGHNLGMSHDTKACICSAKVCIMTDTVSSIIPKLFSSCSLQDFEKYMLNDMPKCLTNIPDINTIVAPPTCGNGFVEKGEECDCGTAEECTNPCCNPETCKLTAGSKCAHGECCENCQYKAAGTVCRAVKDECDLPEMCTGYSGNCPSDRFRMNGHPCNEGEGFCYMGNCPTREQQCKAAFGPRATEGAASCYRMNERGVYYGYCKKKSGSHIPCKRKDIMCGKLFCTGGQEMPTYGSLVTFESCKASFPRDGEGDLGMILNGTKCGDGMVCSNGECVPAEDVFRSSDCSAKCPGHAVCDHELQCQCEEGWAPPTCDSSSAATSFAIIAVVLVILTVTIIAAALLIYFRVFKKSRQTRRGPGATNQVFVDQEQGEHPGLAIPAQKMNDKKLLLPVPPPQENKPQLRSPIIRPKGPPPPIPSTKPASSHTQELFAPEKKPACLPVPKGKPPPPPPPKALKPPVNPRV